MSGAFEAAWGLLKSVQTELGQHHPDFPSSQGPVLGYHGRNFSIRHFPYGEKINNLGLDDIVRNKFGGDIDAMRDDVARVKANKLLHTGLVPTDAPESQVGSGRYHQYDDDGNFNYGISTRFNPAIPPSISVAVEPDTAATYAEGRSGYKDSTGRPGYYGIRAGAMQNALPLDEPLRRYRIGDTDDYIHNPQRYRYIPHGIAPNQMVQFPDAASMKEFDLGKRKDNRFTVHPSRYIGVGPGQFIGRDQNLLDEGKMTIDEYTTPERDTQRVMESEQFIRDQIAQYQQQQQAMAQRDADRQAEQAFRQQQMMMSPQQQLPIGVQ